MCDACENTGLAYTFRGEQRCCTCDLGQAAAEYEQLAAERSDSFMADAHGHVSGVEIVDVQRERNDKGQFIPKQLPVTERVLPAPVDSGTHDLP